MANFTCFGCGLEIASNGEMHPWTLRPDKPTTYFHFNCYINLVNNAITDQERLDDYMEREAAAVERETIRKHSIGSLPD
jgi:hypothetical protein